MARKRTDWLSPSAPAAIRYDGMSGTTEPCARAVQRLIQFGEEIERARILTDGTHHCLLLYLDEYDRVAIKSGFGSGYTGEGSRGFSDVLRLLKTHSVKIDEIDVQHEVFERVDACALTRRDLENIEGADPILPSRWHDYIWERDEERGEKETPWGDFPSVIPLAIVDLRIVDLALDFWTAPDDRLGRAFRRLEDRLRERAGSTEHGVDLVREAFDPPNNRLHWPGLDRREQAARARLFSGAYGTYRNPRAHREQEESARQQLGEFMVVNELYRLEGEAEPVELTRTGGNTPAHPSPQGRPAGGNPGRARADQA